MRCPGCGQEAGESTTTCSSCSQDVRLTVRAPDGTTYGPYTLASIRQYAAQARIPAASTLQTADGKTLALAEMDVVPAPPVVARSAPAQSGTPGLLIAVIIAVVAVVLLPTILILTAILFPVFARAREKARQASCLSNIKQLSLACLQYASANNDTLPNAATWRQDIRPYLPGGFVWDCPSSCKGQQSYEFNPTLGGMSLGAIENPADTIMISEPLGPSGNGPHNRGLNIAFVDGHVRWMLPAQLSQLQGMSSAGGMGP